MMTETFQYTKDCVNVYERAKEKHQYICTVDVSKGRGLDYSIFSIFDVSVRYKQVCTYRDNTVSAYYI